MRLSEMLEKESSLKPKGEFENLGIKVNYEKLNEYIISFYFESHGTNKNYTYNIKLKEIKFIYESVISEVEMG